MYVKGARGVALEGWEKKMGERTIFTEPQGVSMTRVFNIPNTWSRVSSLTKILVIQPRWGIFSLSHRCHPAVT